MKDLFEITSPFVNALKEGCTETVLEELRFQTLAAAKRTLALRGRTGKKQSKTYFTIKLTQL